MRKSKVFKAIQALSIYERNRFLKYLRSPYHNSNQLIIHLFEQIINLISHPDLSDQKESLWSRFSNNPYDDKKLRRLQSELLKSFEGFLALEQYQKNPFQEYNNLLEELKDRKLKFLYRGAIKSSRTLSERQLIKSGSQFYFDYKLETNINELLETDTKRFGKGNYEEISRNLDIFYIIEKLKLYTRVQTLKFFNKQVYNIDFIDFIQSHLKKRNLEDLPVVEIYHLNLLILLKPENRENYFNYKSRLFEYLDLFPPKEGLWLLKQAINHCIRRINIGELKFSDELFEIYKLYINSNAIIQSGFLEEWDFKNIVSIALRVNKNEWARNFIEKYHHYLPESQRQNAYTYNLAVLSFWEKKFNDVIYYLHNVEYSDLTYNLDAKSMLVAAYYELEEFDVLHYSIDAFRTFIGRKNIIAANSSIPYKNYLRFVQKLVKPMKEKTLIKLKKEIEETKPVVSKTWLLHKVNEQLGEHIPQMNN